MLKQFLFKKYFIMATIKYKHQEYIADLKKFCFSSTSTNDAIPFYLFSEGDWKLLEWIDLMLPYSEVMEAGYVQLCNTKVISKELEGILKVVLKYFEKHEQYERLYHLKNLQPFLFGQEATEQNTTTQSDQSYSEELNITLKACEKGKKYVYDICQSKMSFIEVHRCSSFIYEYANVAPDIKPKKIFDLRTKKGDYEWGQLYKRDSKFTTHYYRVLSSINEQPYGYLHLYVSQNGIKEVHYNQLPERYLLKEAAIRFINDYAINQFGLPIESTSTTKSNKAD
jgi:hypothetical protein